jgi:hypothetical protein
MRGEVERCTLKFQEMLTISKVFVKAYLSFLRIGAANVPDDKRWGFEEAKWFLRKVPVGNEKAGRGFTVGFRPLKSRLSWD